jgi:hypothetical protein
MTTSPRATRPRTATWSSSPTRTSPTCRAKTSKEIAVEKFVPADQIDPMWLDKSYYLEPDKAAAKPYVLLRDALESEKRMASGHRLDPHPDDDGGAAGA